MAPGSRARDSEDASSRSHPPPRPQRAPRAPRRTLASAWSGNRRRGSCAPPTAAVASILPSCLVARKAVAEEAVAATTRTEGVAELGVVESRNRRAGCEAVERGLEDPRER